MNKLLICKCKWSLDSSELELQNIYELLVAIEIIMNKPLGLGITLTIQLFMIWLTNIL